MAKTRVRAHRRKSHVKDVLPGRGVRRRRVKGSSVKAHTRRT